MKVKELIRELLDCDLDKEVELYSLIDIEKIDSELPEFEFVGNNISVDETTDVVWINGEY